MEVPAAVERPDQRHHDHHQREDRRQRAREQQRRHVVDDRRDQDHDEQPDEQVQRTHSGFLSDDDEARVRIQRHQDREQGMDRVAYEVKVGAAGDVQDEA